ncbi:MAG: hypothetical protein NTW61_09535 [Candidatus Melainabacteria bacterium]|nr:hypothetical protein [Candidatus Melainabacteria bacterium]
MPMWVPVALIGGSIGAATLVAISLVVNRKKTSAVAPNTEVVSTLANEGAEIVETVGKQGLETITAEKPVPLTKPKTTTPTPWWKQKWLGFVSTVAIIGGSWASFGGISTMLKPVKNPNLVTPATIERDALEIAKAIPPLTKNPLYQLGFECTVETLQVSQSAIKDPKKFPPTIPQTLENLPTAQACVASLPILNRWGTNRPSSFLLAVHDRNNRFVGIQIPKKLSADELGKLTLPELQAKFQPKLGTLVFFTKESQEAYNRLSLEEKLRQYTTKYIAIAPKIDTSKVDFNQPIPIATRFLPKDLELKAQIAKAFALIEASPQGKELVRLAQKYDIALQYSPYGSLDKQNGAYDKDTNAVKFGVALLNKQNLSTTDGFNFLVQVLIHELGHGVIDNERLIAQGKTRPPTKTKYNKEGRILTGVLSFVGIENKSHLEEMTVDTLATTIASQLVGKLPLLQMYNAPLLQMDPSIEFAKAYGFYSHPGLASLGFDQETWKDQEADTIYNRLGIGDSTLNRALATEVVLRQKEAQKKP